MIPIADIEDELIEDIKVSVTGIKTVDTLEQEFNEETLKGLFLKAPLVLIRWVELKPNESERGADGGSGIKHEQYLLVIGAQSLRSRKERQRGCYSIIDILRERYDGGHVLTVEGAEITLQLEAIRYLFTANGVTYYGMWLGRDDN
jgi:hypothetical protein